MTTIRPLIESTLTGIDAVPDEPLPRGFVEAFGESAVTVAVWFWHASTKRDEWEVRGVVARRLKTALDGAAIDIPFPQRTLRFRDTMPWPAHDSEEGYAE